MTDTVAVNYYVMTVCLECGEPMSLKEARATGNQFLGCHGYPQCRFTIPYDRVTDSLSARILALEKLLAEKGTQVRSTKYDPTHHKHLRPVDGGE